MVRGEEGLRHDDEGDEEHGTPAKEAASPPDEAIDEEEIQNERERSEGELGRSRNPFLETERTPSCVPRTTTTPPER